jgi:hypothetical protein
MAKGSIMLQRVTFDGLDPARFAARGVAPAPGPRGTGVGTVGEPAMADVLRTVSGRGTAR